MNRIRVEQVTSEETKSTIDELYKKNGSKGTAKRDDLFFVAYSNDKIIYTHLENFYKIINFKVVTTEEVPQFLIDRSMAYAKSETMTLYMRRS